MRLSLGLALGAILVGGIGGLTIVLRNSQTRAHADVEHSAQGRAALAASLIDSVFSSIYMSPAATSSLSGARVTGAEVASALGESPFAAVVGPRGELLASRPTLPRTTADHLAVDASVKAALSGRPALSNLLSAGGGLPSLFLSSSPFSTPYGRRVAVSAFPLEELRGILQQYLGYVAYYAGARVYLIDGNDVELGSSAAPRPLGQPVKDPELLEAISGRAQVGHYDNGSVFYAIGRLRVAPWRVVYTVPTGVLYASTGNNPTLSYVLLAAFGLAALVCLLLLARLSSRSAELARANVVLAQRNAEVEQANQAKSRFLANMSHELRTPLNAIIGFADLMRDERLGPVSGEHRECLDDIGSSARHLLHLINEVLDLARIESGRTTLDPQPIDPAAVASECVDSLRSLATERDIVVSLDAETVGVVSLDAARLRQVLLNFLSNALKFTPAKGRVVVRVRRQDALLVIEVSDTGPGIAAADQERVFAEFEQLAQPGVSHQRGTGLGLAVTKRIVEAQGGTVGVRSAPGNGSTFYARLPLTAPEPEQEAFLDREHVPAGAR